MMAANIEKYIKDLNNLDAKGYLLLCALVKECFPDRYTEITNKDPSEPLPHFHLDYYSWYIEARHIIELLLDDGLDDFVACYKTSKPRKDIEHTNYCIEDYLNQLIKRDSNGDLILGPNIAYIKLLQQLAILKSVSRVFESSLFKVRQLVQADLFDSDLDSARALLKNGHLRAAGAVAGVVLEKHLEGIVSFNKVTIKKTNPAIGDLVAALGDKNILQTHELGEMKNLNSIRILCVHNKNKEPTEAEVSHLINGITNLIE